MPAPVVIGNNSEGAKPPSTVKQCIHDNGVASVALDRPTKRNALSQSMIDELVSTLQVLDQDSRVRVVLLSATQDGPFCGRLTRPVVEHQTIGLIRM